MNTSEKMAIIANMPFGKKVSFCKKVPYKSIIEANFFMLQIQNKRKSRGEAHIEQRPYFCKDCLKYHLTSKEMREHV